MHTDSQTLFRLGCFEAAMRFEVIRVVQHMS